MTDLYPPCLHCGDTILSRGARGLCGHCYGQTVVRRLYPVRPAGRHPGSADAVPRQGWADPEDEALESRPPPVRQPDDPPWTCVWCGEWRCAGPLRKCGACEALYAKRSAGMPDYHCVRV